MAVDLGSCGQRQRRRRFAAPDLGVACREHGVDPRLVGGRHGERRRGRRVLGQVQRVVEQAAAVGELPARVLLVASATLAPLALRRGQQGEVVQRQVDVARRQDRPHRIVQAPGVVEQRAVADQPHLHVRVPRQLGEPAIGSREQPAAGEPELHRLAVVEQRGQGVDQRRAGDLVAVDVEDPVAAALGEQPRAGAVRVEAELVAHEAVGDVVVGSQRGRIDARVDGDEDLVGDRAERCEERGDLGRRLASEAADRERHGRSFRRRRRGTRRRRGRSRPSSPGTSPTAARRTPWQPVRDR